jgi:hypothetical protein
MGLGIRHRGVEVVVDVDGDSGRPTSAAAMPSGADLTELAR